MLDICLVSVRYMLGLGEVSGRSLLGIAGSSVMASCYVSYWVAVAHVGYRLAWCWTRVGIWVLGVGLWLVYDWLLMGFVLASRWYRVVS